MENYLLEAFEKFLIQTLEFFSQNPESYPSSVDQLEGGFSDNLWEKMEQFVREQDWNKIWLENKPVSESEKFKG